MRSKRLGFVLLFVLCTSLFMWILMQQEHFLNLSNIQPELHAGFIVAQRGNRLPLYTAVSSSLKDNMQNPSQEREKMKAFLYDNITTKPVETEITNVANYHTWHEICGRQINSLLHHPLFPNLPFSRILLHSLSLQNLAENLGVRVFGYIIPDIPGEYQFYIKSKHASVEVWLSVDEAESNAILLCKDSDNEKNSTVKDISSLVRLKRRQYYFEIIGKTGNSKGSIELKWSEPNVKNFDVISSKNLKPFFNDMMYHERQVVLDYKVKEGLPMHRQQPMRESYYSEKNTRRRNIYLLPYIPDAETLHLFPICPYKPSYIIKEPLNKNEGVWETHYSSVYPSDDTDLKYRLKGQLEQVIFGNDVLDEKESVFLVDSVMEALNRKLPG